MTERIHVLTESAYFKYEKLKVQAVNCSIKNHHDSSAIILGTDTNLVFSLLLLESRSGVTGSHIVHCSCGKPELDHFPCKHVVSYAALKVIPLPEFLPLMYRRRSYGNQYESVEPLQSVSNYDGKSRIPNMKLMIRPNLPRKPGRPVKSR